MDSLDQLNLLDWQPPASRYTDPETSHMAATRADSFASADRLMVLEILDTFGPCTDFELADHAQRIQSSMGKRRGELRDKGLVEVLTDAEGGKIKRLSPTNSPALVWRITDRGRSYLADNCRRVA